MAQFRNREGKVINVPELEDNLFPNQQKVLIRVILKTNGFIQE